MWTRLILWFFLGCWLNVWDAVLWHRLVDSCNCKRQKWSHSPWLIIGRFAGSMSKVYHKKSCVNDPGRLECGEQAIVLNFDLDLRIYVSPNLASPRTTLIGSFAKLLDFDSFLGTLIPQYSEHGTFKIWSDGCPILLSMTEEEPFVVANVCTISVLIEILVRRYGSYITRIRETWSLQSLGWSFMSNFIKKNFCLCCTQRKPTAFHLQKKVEPVQFWMPSSQK